MVVARLKDLSADHLWCDHLPIIKRTLILTAPKQQAVPYPKIRKLRPEVLGVQAFGSHLFPGWPLGTSIKHVLNQPKVGIRIMGFHKFDIR